MSSDSEKGEGGAPRESEGGKEPERPAKGGKRKTLALGSGVDGDEAWVREDAEPEPSDTAADAGPAPVTRTKPGLGGSGTTLIGGGAKPADRSSKNPALRSSAPPPPVRSSAPPPLRRVGSDAPPAIRRGPSERPGRGPTSEAPAPPRRSGRDAPPSRRPPPVRGAPTSRRPPPRPPLRERGEIPPPPVRRRPPLREERPSSPAARPSAPEAPRSAPEEAARSAPEAARSRPSTPEATRSAPQARRSAPEAVPAARRSAPEAPPLEPEAPPALSQALPREVAGALVDLESFAAELPELRPLQQVCEAELERRPDAARAARLHFELARAADDPSTALKHFRLALDNAPDHLPAIRAARVALLERQNGKAAMAYFDAEIAAASGPAEKARAHYAKGCALEDVVGDADGARKCFAEAARLAPENPTILKAHEHAELKAKDWERLTQALEHEATATDHPRHRAALLVARARLFERRLNKPADATGQLEVALGLDAETPIALQTLKRMFFVQERWRDLAATLERETSLSSDPAVQTLAWWTISRIYSERLGGSRDDAVVALRRAVEITPNDPMLLGELARLYEQAGDRAGVASALEHLAACITRPEERLSVLVRLAELHAGAGDAVSAARWYENALEIEPGFAPALRSLDDLYTRLERWEELARMCVAEGGANIDSPRRAAALARAADIFETRLGKGDEAVKHYAHALALDPTHDGAFKALVRLYTAAGRWRELIELYGRAVDGARSDDIAITYLLKIGSIYEDTLRDMPAAVDSYRRVLAKKSDHLGALHAIERTAERAGMWHDLVETLDAEVRLLPANEQALMLQHRAAEVTAERLDDLEGAVARLRLILKKNARHAPTLASLGRLYKRLERYAELLTVYEGQLEATPAGPGRVALLVELAELSERRLGETVRAVGFYRQALDADPQHAVARAALKRLLRENRDNVQLAAVLRTELDATTDPPQAARAAFLLGEVYEVHLRQPDKAIACYQRALDAQPSFQPAIDALARVHGAQGSWKDLSETLEIEAGAYGDARMALDARLHAATLRAERLGQTREAVKLIEQIIADDPQNLAAMLTLETLYVEAGQRDALCDLLARQAQVLENHDARVAVLVTRMRLLEGGGADDEAVMAACRDVIAIDATNTIALDVLERLARRRGDQRLLTEVDTLSTKIVTDPAMLAVHYTRLGDSLLASNAASALNAYRTALGYNSDSLGAIRGLYRAASSLGDWATMVEACRREAEWSRDGDASATLLATSAQLRAARLGDTAGAVEDLERALSQSPDHELAAERLTQLLRHLGDVDRLIDRLTHAAQAARKPARKVALWRAVGELYATDKQELGAAITALRRALEVDAKDSEAIMQLAALHERDAQWKEAAELLERLVALDDGNVEAHLELAKLYTKHLQDGPRAHAHLKRVLKELPGDRFALSMLLQLHLDAGERDKARAISQQLLEAAEGDDTTKAWALVEIGRVELRAESFEAAAEALRQAVTIVGLKGEAAKMYRRLLGDKEPWDRYVTALREHLRSSRAGTPEERAGVYLEMANALHERLSRTGDAFAVLEEGLKRCGDHPGLALAMAELLVRTGQLQKAVKGFQQVVARHPNYPAAWRGLVGVLQQLARHAEASAAASGLVVMGEASDVERNLSRERSLRAGVARAGALAEPALRMISAASPEEDARMAMVLSVLADGIAKAYPLPYEIYGVKKSDRLKARSGHPLRQEMERLATAFGLEDFDLYVHAGMGGDVTVELTQPASIMVPAFVVELPEAQRVFLLARPLAAVAAGTQAALKLPPEELALVVAAALRRLVPGYEEGRHDEDRLAQLEHLLAPSWFSRGRVDEALQQYYAEPLDVAQWAPKAIMTASRAAALLSGDLEACLTALRSAGAVPKGAAGSELVGRSPVMADLLRFWMSEGALELRRAAGMI